MFKKITQTFSYTFHVEKAGLYFIAIEASCQSGKKLGFFGGQDLRVEIDGKKFREAPAKRRARYFNVPPSWSGTKLNGLSKTVIFILQLDKGEHVITFIPKKGATIPREPEVRPVKSQDKLLENVQAREGNRRPWITVALVDLPLKTLDISVTCEKRYKDSDDVKLVIDGRVAQNNHTKTWGKDWYWRGSQLKGNTKEARFYPQLPKGIHYIELWADRKPALHEMKIDFGENGKDKDDERESAVPIKKYTYKGVQGNEDYNRYDNEIQEAVNHWNNIFLNDFYPIKEPLDPNLVKAIVYQESRMGYHDGGEINVMQVGNPGDASLRTLNGELQEWWIHQGKKIQLDYKGEANNNTPKNSIKWGVRWLYHKAQKITGQEGEEKRGWKSWKEAVHEYGPGTEEYTDNVWNIYTKGVDKKFNIRLWAVILFSLLVAVATWRLYSIQGTIYFNYKDLGEEYVCIGRARLEIGIRDGLKIKKATIGPIKDESLSTIVGLMKDTIMVDYYDFDNDGQQDVLVSAQHSVGNEVKYFFRIGERALEEIRFSDYSNPYTGDNSIYAEDIFFGGRDEQGKYIFVGKNIIPYSNAPDQAWRTYYRFNNKGHIVIDRVEKETI